MNYKKIPINDIHEGYRKPCVLGVLCVMLITINHSLYTIFHPYNIEVYK